MPKVMSWNKRNVQRWFRILHRDLGYFAVGITLVYALSGFFLSHKNIFSATKTEKVNHEFPKNLSDNNFSVYWKENTFINLNHFKETNETIQIFIDGGTGYYDKSTGMVYYKLYKKRPFIEFINQLHNNQRKGWIYIADTYAFILAFLTISSSFVDQSRSLEILFPGL